MLKEEKYRLKKGDKMIFSKRPGSEKLIFEDKDIVEVWDTSEEMSRLARVKIINNSDWSERIITLSEKSSSWNYFSLLKQNQEHDQEFEREWSNA